MTAWQAFDAGWRRALRAPWMVIGLWTSTLLVAFPAAVTLERMISDHLGASLAAASAASGVNFDWWNEFLAQAAGLGQTFVPAILGFAAVLDNFSSIADARSVPRVIVALVAIHIVITAFLAGGVLDRLARDRATGAHGFFSACGVFFLRFLRLGAAAAALYWALFVWLHPLMFDRAYGALTRDVTVERTAFVYRLALYAGFAALVLAVNLLFDYAKIRMVVEDRRSAIGSIVGAARFIRRQPLATIGLYCLNVLAFAGVVALYAVAVPDAAGGSAPWLALLIGQLYIVLRIVVRLMFAGSQIALFQGRLAHAGYTAAPLPAWPDSPAADAIRPQATIRDS